MSNAFKAMDTGEMLKIWNVVERSFKKVNMCTKIWLNIIFASIYISTNLTRNFIIFILQRFRSLENGINKQISYLNAFVQSKLWL